jgi:hypothetical protein
MRYLLFLIFVALYCPVFAQDSLTNRTGSIASPNAAALGRYGNMPVSLNTGIPTIDIPIYTVSNNGLQLPLSLSYHAGGVKVQDVASNVGLGWVLNAGGVISRTVEGAPDDRFGGHPGVTTHGHFTNFGFSNYTYDVNSAYPTWITHDGMHPVYIRELHQGLRDAEPDIFTFNFLGYSGSFHFSDDRTVVITDGQSLKITPTFQDSLFINSFIVETPDGTRFYFGKSQNGTVDAYEKTAVMSLVRGMVWNPVISSWFLTRIENFNKSAVIDLEYEREQYSYYTIQNNQLISNITSGQADEINPNLLGKTYFDGVRLTKVKTDLITVDILAPELRQDVGQFNLLSFQELANNSSRVISGIQISNNNFCKKYQLFQSYFNDVNSMFPVGLVNGISGLNINDYNIDRKRLKLDSIVELSCDGSIRIPAHSFTYNEQIPPRTLSFSQDHWGFFNAQNNANLLPGFWQDNSNAAFSGGEVTYFSGANRESSWPQMKAGVLEKITYPTGGTTSFEYEPNDVQTTVRDLSNVVFANGSIGYDGSNPVSRDFPVTINAAGVYKVTLVSSANGTDAALRILSGGSLITPPINVTTLSTASNSQAIDIFLNIGTYTFRLWKDCVYWNSSGNPISAGVGANFGVSKWQEISSIQNKLVGGLRIKKIISADLLGHYSEKQYSYRQDGSNSGKSSGFLYSRPTYVALLRNDILKEAGSGSASNLAPLGTGCQSLDFPGVHHRYIKSPNSILPLESVGGAPVGYIRVEESVLGYGKTVYEYEQGSGNLQPLGYIGNLVRNGYTCDQSSPNYPPAPLPPDPLRGVLKTKSVFDESGVLKNREDYIIVFSTNQFVTPGLKFGKDENMFTFYDLTSYRKTAAFNRSVSYSGPDSLVVTDSTFFTSAFHNLPTLATSKTSQAFTNVAKTTYGVDILDDYLNVDDGIGTYLGAIANANVEYYSTNITNCGNYSCHWVKWQRWRRKLTVARQQLIATRIANFTASNSVYNTKLNQLSTSSNPEVAALGKALKGGRIYTLEELQTVDGLITSGKYYQYGVNQNNLDLVSQYILPRGQNIFTTYTGASFNAGLIQKSNKYKWVAGYLYENDRLVETTDVGGNKTSVLWAGNNNFPALQSSTLSYQQLKTAAAGWVTTASFPSNQSLENVISNISTAYPHASVVARNFLAGLGVSYETSSQRQSLHYEYDVLGRLITVKDKNFNIVKAIDYKYNSTANQ